MWLGMLAGANVAMVWFRRCAAFPSRRHSFAMFTGGNLGMIAGMFAGGWCAGQFSTESISLTAGLSFTQMTVGMLSGMLIGTWLFEWAMGLLWNAPKLPRWFRTAVTDTAG
jgi:hypothetical protein